MTCYEELVGHNAAAHAQWVDDDSVQIQSSPFDH